MGLLLTLGFVIILIAPISVDVVKMTEADAKVWLAVVCLPDALLPEEEAEAEGASSGSSKRARTE